MIYAMLRLVTRSLRRADASMFDVDNANLLRKSQVFGFVWTFPIGKDPVV